MSHTLRKVNLGNSAFVESTIVDYVNGGETYTLAELGITGPIQAVYFIVPDAFSSTGFIPRFTNGVVIIESRPGGEINSQTGLNYTFLAIVHGA